MQKIIILSPHYDGAALSMTRTAAAWALAGSRIKVINIFTHSVSTPFTRPVAKIRAIARQPLWFTRRAATLAIKGDLRIRDLACSALRRFEYLPAMRRYRSPIQSFDLSMKDAPIREPGQKLFRQDFAPDPLTLSQVSGAIAPHTASGDFVIAPLGIGNHVDHLYLHLAAMLLVRSEKLAFYEDLPYCIEGSVDCSAARTSRATAASQAMLLEEPPPLPGQVEWKLQLIAEYSSQFTAGRFLEMAGVGEKVWIPGRGCFPHRGTRGLI